MVKSPWHARTLPTVLSATSGRPHHRLAAGAINWTQTVADLQREKEYLEKQLAVVQSWAAQNAKDRDLWHTEFEHKTIELRRLEVAADRVMRIEAGVWSRLPVSDQRDVRDALRSLAMALQGARGAR